MEILRLIRVYAEDKGLPFMLIGGQAANYYGISRQTGDIDLLVRSSDKDQWHSFLTRLSYKAGQNSSVFARYRADLGTWPIDLMYVDDDTFKKIYDNAKDSDVNVGGVKVISPEHLVMLKLHALKHFQPERFSKDYSDLILLLKTGTAKMTKAELEGLCLKYATSELYEKIISEVELA